MDIRSYQVEGAKFLVDKRGAILGDRCGLGKTMTALLACRYATAQTILITCPKNLKSWWIKEIVSVASVYSDAVKIQEHSALPTVFVTTKRGIQQYILTHYEQFRGRGKTPSPITQTITMLDYDIHIIDECHKIKNRKSQQSKWLKHIKAGFRWGLTGTPVAEFPHDLWSLLNWIDPKVFNNFYHFVATYCEMAWNMYSGRREPVNLTDEGRRMLRDDTKSYLLVRTLDDVGMELPSVTITDIPLELSDDHKKFYCRVQKEIIIDLKNNHIDLWAGNITDDQLVITTAGARFTRLHQVCSDPGVFQQTVESAKVDWLKDYIEGGGEPAVIMSRYRHTVDTISKLVGVNYIVGTYSSLSTGHNLQHLHNFIAWDMPYSRLEWEQAMYRLDRVGQTHPVQIYRLQYSGTVDVKVRDLVDKKHSIVMVLNTWLRGLHDER
jgi:SNF2 family DNA or RNA helicase